MTIKEILESQKPLKARRLPEDRLFQIWKGLVDSCKSPEEIVAVNQAFSGACFPLTGRERAGGA